MTDTQEKLILKYLQGTLSEEERVSFELWVDESEENKKQVSDFKKIWSTGVSPLKNTNFQHNEEWTRLSAAIHETPVISLNRKSFILRIAAATTIFLIASFVIYLTVIQNKTTTYESTAEVLHLILPDGSEVWLNENSELAYTDAFTESRTLSLSGEAFFDVKPNPERPFVIQTDKAQVRVLGTSFNVKANYFENQTEVFVVTGKVSFSATDLNKSIILLPGSNGVFDKEKGVIAHDSEEHLNSFAWKDKKLVFRKTPLREVIKTLNSYFKTDIQVSNKDLSECRFTGSFNNPTIEEVIETIQLALDLQVKHQANTYALDGQGCNTN